MQRKINLLLLLCSIVLCSSQCKKTNTTEPADQLPPATQIGANTFGCLVNGKVYIPKGYSGNGSSNPVKIYEFGFNGRPYLDFKGYQIVNSEYKGFAFIGFSNLDHLGNYTNPADFNFSFGWTDVIGTCGTVAFDTTIKKWGSGIITRLDVPNRIVSGTFNCKFKTLQCDTVFITDGRFDIKF
jgi:hypothetical protein